MSVTFIEHHGVKGMRWGVRKDRSHQNRTKKRLSSKVKKIAVTSASLVGVGLTIYGGMKVKNLLDNKTKKEAVAIDIGKTVCEEVLKTTISQTPVTKIETPKVQVPTIRYDDFQSAMKANQKLLDDLLKELS